MTGRVCLPALLFGFLPSAAQAQRAAPDTFASFASSSASRADSLHLRDVLARAAQQHPLIDAARARVRAAQGARMTSRTLPNPVLSYWVENNSGSASTPATYLARESQLTATLPLEPLFQRWPRIRQAESEVDAARADLAQATQLVMLDAARAFYRVAAAQVAVGTASDIRAGLAELVTYNDARVREGVAAEGDLIRTQLELNRVDANVTFERVELVRALAALAPYLGDDRIGTGGIDQSTTVTLDDAAGTPAQSLPALDALVASARINRPDVRAARARAAAANAEVSAQRTLTIRQLGATFGTKRTLGVTSLIAGVTMPLPFLDQNRGEVQRASGERSAMEQEALWTERQAMAEVTGALEAVRLFRLQADQLRGSFLARAEESRRIAVAAYQEGAVSLLQVLDASRTLADARTMYYRTMFAERQSILELNIAIGALPSEPLLLPDSRDRI